MEARIHSAVAGARVGDVGVAEHFVPADYDKGAREAVSEEHPEEEQLQRNQRAPVEVAKPVHAFVVSRDDGWVLRLWWTPVPPRDWARALGLGSPRPHLRRDWAHPGPNLHRDSTHRCHICTGIGLTPPTSTYTRTGSPLPHLHQDWAHPGHICAGTGLAPAHICTGSNDDGGSRAPASYVACAAVYARPPVKDPEAIYSAQHCTARMRRSEPGILVVRCRCRCRCRCWVCGEFWLLVAAVRRQPRPRRRRNTHIRSQAHTHHTRAHACTHAHARTHTHTPTHPARQS